MSILLGKRSAPEDAYEYSMKRMRRSSFSSSPFSSSPSRVVPLSEITNFSAGFASSSSSLDNPLFQIGPSSSPFRAKEFDNIIPPHLLESLGNPFAPPPKTREEQLAEAMVSDLSAATSPEDALSRAKTIVLQLEQQVKSEAEAVIKQKDETINEVAKQNEELKQHLDALQKENQILKKAVVIQTSRSQAFKEKEQESEQLRQMLQQYEERLRRAELNNYALSLRLQQSGAGAGMSSIPDVF